MANILIFDLWSLRARAPVTQPLSKAMTCTVVVVGDVRYLLIYYIHRTQPEPNTNTSPVPWPPGCCSPPRAD